MDLKELILLHNRLTEAGQSKESGLLIRGVGQKVFKEAGPQYSY